MPRAMAARRSPSGASLGVRITSTWTRFARRDLSTSTIPTPHRVRPGSMPRTRREEAATLPGYARARRRLPGLALLFVFLFQLGLHLWGQVEVAEDVLHVFAVFESVD